RTRDAVGMMVERGREIRRRVTVVEIVAPARLAAIGVGQRAAENIEICRVDEAAGGAGHVRLAVHGREGGDIAEGPDRLRLVAGPPPPPSPPPHPPSAPACAVP